MIFCYIRAREPEGGVEHGEHVQHGQQSHHLHPAEAGVQAAEEGCERELQADPGH